MPASPPRVLPGGRPRVTVLTLGGTIAMAPATDGGLQPALAVEELLAALDGVGALAEVRIVDLMNRPSPHLTFNDLDLVARRTRDLLAGDSDGVVVVQGTDCIEVTAFVLDLLVRGEAPVVVTGAMRGAQAVGADGPANLAAAICVAAAEICRGLGALVVMNDEIHAARLVTKRHSSNPGAFMSDPGPLGRVVEGRQQVLLHPPPLGLPLLPPPGAAARPLRVLHVPAEIDDEGALVWAALDSGCDGMVISGMGGGHVAPAMVPALAEAAEHIPSVLATSCSDGGTLAETYGYAGAEIDLAKHGLIRAGYLSASKARAALILLLGAKRSKAEVRAFFAHFGGE